LGIAIERHYATPQDIEWAWLKDKMKTGKFLILQARPMTALPEPLKISPVLRRIVPMLAEMWPMRPYPLDMTTFTGTLERAVGNLLVTIIGESAPDPDKGFVEEEGVVVRFQPPEVRPSPGMLIAPWLALWRTRHYDPARWQEDPLLPQVIARARELEARDLRLLTWTQNIETLHEALVLIPSVMQLRERYLPQAILGLGSLWLLLAMARRGNQMGALLGGVETKTTETNQALETLAGQIRSDPVLRDLFDRLQANELQSALAQSQQGQAFLEGFAAFLAEYGHRETALTISQGAWKDQPEIVLGILKVLAARRPQELDSYQTWRHSRDELLAHSGLGAGPLRSLFIKALANGRSLFQIREDTHFYATMAQPVVRRVALQLGSRLEQAGVLNPATDIFHLRLDELETLGDAWPPSEETRARLRALVARRRAKREALAATPMVDPRLLTGESQAQPGEDVLLSGSPGSPGLAGGPARIVRDGSEFGKLQPGDVLVAPVTNPAWTPLFLHAVAVVVDTGGSASHAAIVAREYGVPAVMGTITGTQQLTDGQWIQVDGSRGLVLKGEKPE
jgi:pyruvate,water dikinase